ncbi:MAG: ADP-ribosylglycohydrolase family protein [Phototrophicaceae bacterium]
MPDNHPTRLARARISLEGLSVADALGGFFEFQNDPSTQLRVISHKIPEVTWHYTDDTNMALSVYEMLRRFEGINQDALALSFGQHYERGRGYGMSMHSILPKLGKGEDWRTVAKGVFNGGSFGNGGPMKIAPLGAYYADDMSAVIEQAQRVAEITHAHPESLAGCVAVAVAAALAWNHCEGEAMPPSEFIQRVFEVTPDSEVRQGILRGLKLTTDTPLKHVVTILGNGNRVASMDTVPLVIWIAAIHPRDYERAIWTCIRAGGDVDTVAAMVGGIVACGVGMEGIPSTWIGWREPLPAWALG